MRQIYLSIPWVLALVCGSAASSVQAQPNAAVLNCLRGDTLFWQQPTSPCGALGSIEVYGSREATGPFTLLGTVAADLEPFYPLTEFQANSNLNFFNLVAVYPTCTPQRSPRSNTLDGSPLLVPRILSVDYTPNGTRIRWQRPADERVTKYFIYRETATGTTLLDSVLNGVTEYFEIGTQVERAPAIYYLSSLNDCGSSSFSSSQFSSAVVDAERDACAGTVRIVRRLAVPWPFGLTEAVVSRRRLNGRIDSVRVAVTDTVITLPDLAADTAYTLKVRFDDAGGGFTAALPVDLSAVDFVADDRIEVSQLTFENDAWQLRWRWEPRAGYETTEYVVRQGGNEVARVATDPDFDILPAPTVTLAIPPTFDWSSAEVIVRSTDGCGVLRESAPARPSVVSGTEVSPFDVAVAWTLPQSGAAINRSWDLRFADGTIGSRLLLETETAQAFVHDVTDVNFRQVCYETVTTVELPAVFRRQTETLPWRSAPTCVLRSPRVYLPTGFAPEGYTIEYRPRLSLTEGLGYEMEIYDRWGKRLFQTDSPFEGWSGRAGREFGAGGDLPGGRHAHRGGPRAAALRDAGGGGAVGDLVRGKAPTSCLVDYTASPVFSEASWLLPRFRKNHARTARSARETIGSMSPPP